MSSPKIKDGFSVPPKLIDPFPIGTQLVGAWSEIPPEFGGPQSLTWKLCIGTLLHISGYPELYRRIGTKYNTGGEAAYEFRLPDKRGRTSIGSGTGSGLTNRVQGVKLGEETHAQTLGENGPHTHSETTALRPGGTYNLVTAGVADFAGGTTGSSGSGTGHNTMQPSEVDLWIIKC